MKTAKRILAVVLVLVLALTALPLTAGAASISDTAKSIKNGEKVKSPGVLYKHYSPRCETALFETDELCKAVEFASAQQKSGKKVAVLCENEKIGAFEAGAILLPLGRTEEEMAENLYALLRRAEKEAELLVAVEPQKKDGVMAGVMNRLKKACRSTDIQH